MFTGFLLPRSPRNVPEGRPGSTRPATVPAPAVHDVTVRMAAEDDRVAIERLAALDSARVPSGTLVVAVIAGTIQAAQPVSGGPAIANPFVPSLDLVNLLQVRARQLRDAGVDGREAAPIIQLRGRPALADGAA
jgi:hypothetical protein